MKANKKKIIVLVAMVLLLVATGCLNYFLNVKGVKAGDDNNLDASTYTFFTDFRLDREALKEQTLIDLDAIIATNSSVEAVKNAEDMKLAILENAKTELTLEGLIMARGFEDVIVTVNTDNVNVVVKDTEITKEEASQIIFVVVSETDFVATDINIIPGAK